MSDKIVCWGTKLDGTHVPIGEAEAQALLESVRAREEADAKAMPDTKAALSALLRAKERMGRLGWRDGIYCPKDGSPFAVVQFGSTGIFSGHYDGDWPDGSIFVADGWTHPKGCMWKSMDALSDEERETLSRCDADNAEWISSLGARLAAPTEDPAS